MEDKRLEAFGRLLAIMDDLRSQCPWDMKQTMESLRYLTIEEVHELSDAILDKDMEEIKGELGDIMLHMVFYSKIASEKGAFDITDVLNAICDKLIHRHPHIYGDVKVTSEEDVKKNWEALKKKEGRKSVLGGVPRSLPPLIKANRIQEKARGAGFDWEQPEQVLDKVREELDELSREVAQNESHEKIESEFGDFLFSVINYARFLNINPADALERTNKKFIARFNYIEQKAKEMSRDLHEMSLEEMDVLWEEAKKMENY